jgi:GT2 family glycosyltransferase
MTMDRCGISILIATCNRPKMLGSCIESLLVQKPKTSCEILTLDQSDVERRYSPPSGESRVRPIYFDFKHKSRALNLGVDLASSDNVAFTDDDCIAEEQWIESMHEALSRQPNAVVTGRVIAGEVEEDAVRSRLHAEITERVVYQKGRITPIFKMWGCNFGFNKASYRRIGPFNEALGPGTPFKGSEDNEWSYRALREGLEIIYDPEVIVYHRSWRDKRDDAKLMRDYGYAAGALFAYISSVSKRDFLYHSLRLSRTVLGRILFSFDSAEIRNYLGYGANFIRGLRAYRQYVGRQPTR